VGTPQSRVQDGPPRPQDASLEGPGGAAATFCAVKPGNPHGEGKQRRYTWSLRGGAHDRVTDVIAALQKEIKD
jgi:hypothetical protein